jgi:hypothetical protein
MKEASITILSNNIDIGLTMTTLDKGFSRGKRTQTLVMDRDLAKAVAEGLLLKIKEMDNAV